MMRGGPGGVHQQPVSLLPAAMQFELHVVGVLDSVEVDCGETSQELTETGQFSLRLLGGFPVLHVLRMNHGGVRFEQVGGNCG